MENNVAKKKLPKNVVVVKLDTLAALKHVGGMMANVCWNVRLVP